MLNALNEFIANAQNKLPDGKTRLVVIADNLDRIVLISQGDRTNHDEIFLDRSQQLQGLQCHTIYTIPISMVYSSRASDLRDIYGDPQLLPMIMVKTPDEQPYGEGIQVIKQMIQKRIQPFVPDLTLDRLETDIFANKDILDRLCLMSGGHVRNVMLLIRSAMDYIDQLPITDAWHNRGVALRNLGRYEEAIASYDRALEIEADNDAAWFGQGYALVELGRYEEAIASYDRAVEIKPDYHDAWNNRGIALGDLGRYEEAIASYDRAVEIKPDYPDAWYNRGIALGNLGRYEEAIASYDRAVEIKPDDHQAWNGRGVSLRNLGRYEEALASYDRAVEIKPDYHDAWYGRGYALDELGRYEEAIASYDRAVEIKPDDHQAWINKGYAFLHNGQLEIAVSSLDKSLEISSDRGEYCYHRACFAAVLKEDTQVFDWLSQAIKLDEKYRERAKTDTDFDPLRDHPQFQALLNPENTPDANL